MRNQKKEEDRTGEKEDLVLQQRSNNCFFFLVRFAVELKYLAGVTSRLPRVVTVNFTRYNKTETLRGVAPLKIVVRKF